jgi:hypothetical protein
MHVDKNYDKVVEIETGHLIPGLYFSSITIQETNQLITKRFVKE